MNKQDNPHAKGLSVNQDVMIEDVYDPVINQIQRFAKHTMFDLNVFTLEACNRHSDHIHAIDNYRQGLALTNPEE
jgi:hypothetical protein